MISLQCGITFCMNFTRSLNLRIALIHLVRSNLLSLANNNSILDFLDLSLHINEDNKICVDVYAKPTNSFTYVLPSTCYPKKSINKVPKRIALRLRRICNSDDSKLRIPKLPDRKRLQSYSIKKTVSLCWKYYQK